MASVVLADDTVLGRQVALKRLDATAVDRHVLLRLRREAVIGASMSHPNLVSIYDVIEDEGGRVTIVMEYVEGETLRAALKREGRLPAGEAVRVLRGVAAGLDAIHERGIVHRDVKPANVLLGVDGRVKLADLGIASVPDHTRITTAGTVLGSFRYMAPEQLKDGPATRAIDIYALAAMAFEMLSGRQARREDNPLAVAHAIATRPPPDLREAWPEAPAEAVEVIKCGMCRDPAGRPESASQLVMQLDAALEPEPATTVATPIRTRVISAAAPAAAGLSSARPLAARGAPPVGGPGSSAASSGSRAGSPATPGPRSVPVSAAAADGTSKTYRSRSVAGRVLAPLALGLAVAAVLFAVLDSGQKSPAGSRVTSDRAAARGASAGSAKPHTSTHKAAKASGAATGTSTGGGAAGTSTGSAGASSGASSTPAPPVSTPAASGASAAATPSAGTPVSATESFYHLAAAHRYPQAWALADETFRRQLGGYDSFVGGQSADRSITFDAARTIRQDAGAALVYVRTTSVRTTGTQHCSGTVQLVPRGSSSWLLHLISISCQ